MNRATAGLQQERTALAWHRTALVFLVDGLLLLRIARNKLPYNGPTEHLHLHLHLSRPHLAGYTLLAIGLVFIFLALFLYLYPIQKNLYLRDIQKSNHRMKFIVAAIVGLSSLALCFYFAASLL